MKVVGEVLSFTFYLVLLGALILSLCTFVCVPCRAIGYIPGVVFYPLVTWTLLVLLFIYWAVVALYPLFLFLSLSLPPSIPPSLSLSPSQTDVLKCLSWLSLDNTAPNRFLLTSSTPQHVISISDQLESVTDSAANITYMSGEICIQAVCVWLLWRWEVLFKYWCCQINCIVSNIHLFRLLVEVPVIITQKLFSTKTLVSMWQSAACSTVSSPPSKCALTSMWDKLQSALSSLTPIPLWSFLQLCALLADLQSLWSAVDRQLLPCPGRVYHCWCFCLLLLGLEQEEGHSPPDHRSLIRPRFPVSAAWYLATNVSATLPPPVLPRFHTGSLSFGALIIAVIQLIRITLAYIQKKLKGSTGKIAQAILTCMQCCFFILEKVLRYINKQAYIEVSRGERKEGGVE